MMNGKVLVLVEDGTTVHGGVEFGVGGKGVEEKGKEEDTTTGKGTTTIGLKVVEAGTNDKAHDDVEGDTEDVCGGIT